MFLIPKNDTIFCLQLRLWGHLGKRRQKQLVLLFLLMMLASISEVISIGAMLPFLTVLTTPERLIEYPLIHKLKNYFSITTPENFLIFATVAFCIAVLFSGLIRFFLLWANTRFSYLVGAEFSANIYRKTLFQPYLLHVKRNSSEVISGITSKVGVAILSINSILVMLGSILMLISILIALIWIDPVGILVLFSGFLIVYGAIVVFTRKALLSNGQKISFYSTQAVKSLQEGLGGIRDILIGGTQEFYCRIYRDADTPLRRALGDNNVIAASPRYIIEPLGTILIAVLAWGMSTGVVGVGGNAIVLLGVLAIGAQRLLPALQQIFNSWSNLKGNQASLSDVLLLLDQPLPKEIFDAHKIGITSEFKKKISLENISFRYDSFSPWVLKDINLEISKGDRVGFIGATGSGKSTLLDIFMALLSPTEGHLMVDGEIVDEVSRSAWQANIAHVPQSIYLSDTSVAENIAFGVPKQEIDLDRVRRAAGQAQIASTIELWPSGYETVIGERGVFLSGGQRQRIGIARALYQEASVIIFDEATSALDVDTEKVVMEAINNLSPKLTILTIAHRISTLKNCNVVYELRNKTIIMSKII